MKFAEDIFRRELSATVSALQAWASTLKDVASFDERQAVGFWRISAKPAAQGACPLTLVLRADQKFDLSLGDERFEDRNIENFALFQKIALAASDGRVETVTSECALTGTPRAIETRVFFEHGGMWRNERRLLPGPAGAGEEALIERVHRFLPYRR